MPRYGLRGILLLLLSLIAGATAGCTLDSNGDYDVSKAGAELRDVSAKVRSSAAGYRMNSFPHCFGCGG